MQSWFEKFGINIKNGVTKYIVLGIFFLIFLVLNTYAIYSVFTSRGNFVIWDFQPLHVASRELLKGKNPYSEEVTQIIQLEAYGRLPVDGEDVHAFAYPLYLAYLALPLAWIPSSWAQALWLTILECAIFISIGLIVKIWEWPSKPLVFVGVFLWCLLFYPLVWSFILGQVVLLVFVLVMFGVWAIVREHEWLAGVSFGLAIIKPNLVFLLLPAVLLWGVIRRRWQFVGTLGVTIGILISIPTIFHPHWILDFITRLFEYSRYAPFPAPLMVALKGCCPGSLSLLYPILVILLIAGVIYNWWQAIRSSSTSQVLLAVCFTLIVTTSIAPRIALVNQVILLLPAIGVFKIFSLRGHFGIAVIIVLGLIWGIGFWLLSWLLSVSNTGPLYILEHQVMSPVLPLSMLLVYLLTVYLLRTAYSSLKT